METASELVPTLWRTCRVLANKRRLGLVAAMADHPGQTVCAIAAACGIPEAICSHGLRQIQARGLCRAVRSGRWVAYSLTADPRVAQAQTLLCALTPAVKACRSDYTALIAALTAYTHPRRIALVAALRHAGPSADDALGMRCGISPPALYRHLKKLARRGVVRHADGLVSLLPQKNAFARALYEIASGHADVNSPD
jgi:DNA-binding transcriptional ArsR family regulator